MANSVTFGWLRVGITTTGPQSDMANNPIRPRGSTTTCGKARRPTQPFRDNILHYNWHFFWHWGNGEIGNNGVHTVDLCRWALGVDFPTRVTAVGGRYRYDDDQQTPDTLTATWECNGKMLQWEGLSWSRSLAPMRGVGIELRGSKGSMLIDDGGCSTFDPAGKLVGKTGGSRGDAEHLQNFLDAIHGNAHVNVSVEDGHKAHSCATWQMFRIAQAGRWKWIPKRDTFPTPQQRPSIGSERIDRDGFPAGRRKQV